MKRRILTFALTALLLTGGLLPRGAAADSRFPAVRTYTGQFRDVSEDAWYYRGAAALYELGLSNGQGAGRFAPDSEITVAEALAMAARLRSLYEHGSCEIGPAQYGGAEWYAPYAAYLQALGVIGGEFDGMYRQAATRAQMAHILANILPEALFEPVNRELAGMGYENGNYIKDVPAGLPYREDILKLYEWGIAGGVDGTGSFRPDGKILRCQAAAMITRLVDSELRIRLDWDPVSAYTKAGTTMADLIYSDGIFYPAPSADETEKIDADVRYMLSRGERSITLRYPANTLTGETMNGLLQAFLDTVRGYVEQTYNAVRCAYSAKTGSVTLNFSSSLYKQDELEKYREETMERAVAVHDSLWADRTIFPGMSQYDKARAYFTWICENCVYDFSSTDTSMSHTGYSAFVDGKAVCDGYTAAYNLLLKLEGIECTTVSRGDHIWTAAVLDGNPLHIDTTWGDQSSAIAYRFFAMTETEALERWADRT